MLDGGADPLYVGRRMIRMASEDIGLADPRALPLALDAAETYERLGSPEGELALAQARDLSRLRRRRPTPSTPRTTRRARSSREDGSRPVPLHLRNAPTKLMKDLGYGKGYRYAHDEEDAYAAGEHYLPDDMPDVSFYEPTDRGLEAQIREKLRDAARDATRGKSAAAMTDAASRRAGIDVRATRLTQVGASAKIRAMLDINLLRNDLAARRRRASPSAASRSTSARFEALEARAQDDPDAHAGAAGEAQRAVQADRRREGQGRGHVAR